MQKPVEKPIKFIKNLSTKGKSYPITHVSAVIDDNGESVKSTIDSLKNKGSLTKVTWLELKDKRDAGKLIPGALYCITDYNCTTTQENTRSAGHQFDIVLLALSENKLSEEGWAMMNESNIYDVTFSDGVTKKCWLYLAGVDTGGNQLINVVDTESRLGIPNASLEEFTINESGKTAFTEDWTSAELGKENLTYNYFQNSNLSAWKVWYCLDNDKSRFSWADDSIDEDVPANITMTEGEYGDIWERDPSSDFSNFYGWVNGLGSNHCFTESESPNVGDDVFNSEGESYKGGTVTSYTPAHEGTGLPNGRGVIYRLIDEFNNDVAYDFKNIQFVRKLTDGEYDDSTGTDTWVYTFNAWNSKESICLDASIVGNILTDDGGLLIGCKNNKISLIDWATASFGLSNNVFLGIIDEDNFFYGQESIELKKCYGCTIENAPSIATIYGGLSNVYTINVESIYINNKKVLTEE